MQDKSSRMPGYRDAHQLFSTQGRVAVQAGTLTTASVFFFMSAHAHASS